jgi:hypothetical protein
VFLGAGVGGRGDGGGIPQRRAIHHVTALTAGGAKVMAHHEGNWARQELLSNVVDLIVDQLLTKSQLLGDAAPRAEPQDVDAIRPKARKRKAGK